MRLFNSRARRPEPDFSIKQFAIVTRDGAALATYAGVGRLPSGQHVSDLMVDLLRGEMRTLDETVAVLRAFATYRIASIATNMPEGLQQHTFVVAGHRGPKPYFAEIRNVDIEPVGDFRRLTLRQDFAAVVIEVPHKGLCSIVGVRDSVSDTDLTRLNRIRGLKPARAQDFLQVLADTTRRAAGKMPKFVSKECWGWYLGPNSTQPDPPVLFRYSVPIPTSSTPRVITHGFDFAAAMDYLVREQVGLDDPSKMMANFEEAMRQAMRIEAGQRVVNAQSGEFGRVAVDPVPGGDTNDIGIVWDSDPHNVQVIHRGSIVVVPPGD